MDKDTRTTIKLNATMQAIVDRMIEVEPVLTGSSPTKAVEMALTEWYQTKGGREMEEQAVHIGGGDMDEVGERAWEQYVGPVSVAEFIRGYDTPEQAVEAHLAQFPAMGWGEAPDEVVVDWTDRATYTLREVLVRYIDRTIEEGVIED